MVPPLKGGTELGTMFCTIGDFQMRLSEDIKPITYMKTQAAELLQKVTESRRPVVITQNGEAKAVLVDIESYEALKNAALMLKLTAQGEADVQAGRTLPQDQALSRVRARLTKR
jgi:prevent-host-death family protein